MAKKDHHIDKNHDKDKKHKSKEEGLKKNLLDQEEEIEDDKKREKKKRKEKPREPNVLGGFLTVLTLVVLFFAIRAFSHAPSPKTAETAQQEYQRRQEEKTKAENNIKSQLSDSAQNVRGNFTDTNPLDAAMDSLDKVNHDIDAAKHLPEETAKTVKNLKIGDAINIVINTTGRLGKVYTDAKEVHKAFLKQISKL